VNLAILGTGMVGSTIGARLIELGHSVMIGSRSHNNEKAAEWVKTAGAKASQGTFAEAAKFGEVIFNCTNGAVSLEALKLAGEENLSGKLLIDVANPLDFSKGMPPSLAFCNTDSLGEQIQNAFPSSRVVKALNTMNCEVMVHPERVPGNHNVFISGNDAEAKSQSTDILADWFGWQRENIIDLGDITNARATEMLLPIWLRLMGVIGHANFNFKINIGAKS
jgi:8-hydroxy-5-deazaflavin:NADPH oxidoreductase